MQFPFQIAGVPPMSGAHLAQVSQAILSHTNEGKAQTQRGALQEEHRKGDLKRQISQRFQQTTQTATDPSASGFLAQG